MRFLSRPFLSIAVTFLIYLAAFAPPTDGRFEVPTPRQIARTASGRTGCTKKGAIDAKKTGKVGMGRDRNDESDSGEEGGHDVQTPTRFVQEAVSGQRRRTKKGMAGAKMGKSGINPKRSGGSGRLEARKKRKGCHDEYGFCHSKGQFRGTVCSFHGGRLGEENGDGCCEPSWEHKGLHLDWNEAFISYNGSNHSHFHFDSFRGSGAKLKQRLSYRYDCDFGGGKFGGVGASMDWGLKGSTESRHIVNPDGECRFEEKLKIEAVPLDAVLECDGLRCYWQKSDGTLIGERYGEGGWEFFAVLEAKVKNPCGCKLNQS